jgi:uncharacterized membrane protein
VLRTLRLTAAVADQGPEGWTAANLGKGRPDPGGVPGGGGETVMGVIWTIVVIVVVVAAVLWFLRRA